MTATDELRRLLDERGVEWWQSANTLGCVFTRWHSSLFGDEVVAMENGKEGLVLFDHFMTPEQAIAATLDGGYQGFWTHDGTLHIELPKLPESISVRLSDKRDREVHSARVWQYTLSDADATRERQGVGTCKADETDTVECVCDGIGHYGESLTVHVMECSACGGTYEYVNGSYEYCPRCGKVVVE